MSSPEEPAIDPDRLNGWKEIATFLAKGVRTVQRWEKDYGLPVRRLGRDGGEIVFASRQELRAWMHAQSEPDVAPEARPAPAVAPSTQSDVADGDWRPRHWATVALAALAIVVVVVTAGPQLRSALARGAAQPARWEVNGGRLHVFDPGGALLFSKSFPFVMDAPYDWRGADEPGGLVLLRDLDGDGTTEVAFAAKGRFDQEEALHVYNADGTQRFEVRPRRRVTFGSTTYAGPWSPQRLFVSARPDGGLNLHVVLIHHSEFPNLLVELDHQGRTIAEYWSNGYIQNVVAAEWNGRRALFVGAANNDTWGGSLAIFAQGHATGAAPAEDVRYRCADCPAGGPSEFLVFPRRCIARATPGKATAMVQSIRVEYGGAIRVWVGEGDLTSDGVSAADAWYLFEPGLRLAEAAVGHGTMKEHARLHASGFLDHPYSPHDDRDLFPVRRWNGRRFTDLPRVAVTR